MDASEIRAWLDSHVNLERLVGVPSGSNRRMAHGRCSRMQKLVELLGSPQLQYPAIHITGTNGKTSAARITTALLWSTAGLSVGTDTSPYLERFNERISWNGEPIPDDDLDRILLGIADVELVLRRRGPSYFEIINAAALEWFADVAVDVAVIEVGLGGSWDSTNVVDGQVAVVTNVELDHVEYLGPSRAGIAEEKAGIVKPGATLVLGETDPELAPIFAACGPERDRAARPRLRRARERRRGRRTARRAVHAVRDATPTCSCRCTARIKPTTRQRRSPRPSASSIARSAHDIVEAALVSVQSPGRLEVVGHNPLVVIDGTKNVAGARVVRAALAEEFPQTASHVGDRCAPAEGRV